MDDEFDKVTRNIQEQMSELIRQNEQLEAKTGTFMQTRRDSEVRKSNYERLEKLDQDRKTFEKLKKWSDIGRMIQEADDYQAKLPTHKQSAHERKKAAKKQEQETIIRNPASF